jgi:hypothetical protein
MLSYLGWLNLLDRITTMVEVVFKKVLELRLGQNNINIFFLKLKGGGEKHH